MDHDFSRLIDDALHALWQRDPVTATFAGESAYDALLPHADDSCEVGEIEVLDRLAERLATIAVPDNAAARIDARHLDAHCTLARSAFARRARYHNPAWYTGEAAFGLISLLLGDPSGEKTVALEARLRVIPAFLNDAAARLHDVPIPAAWVARAQTELAALMRLVHDALPLHPAGKSIRAADPAAVTDACVGLSETIAAAPDADAACGEAHLALVIERIHGLHQTPAALERLATEAFETVRARLRTQARKLDPARTWREQMTQLAETAADDVDIIATYRYWNERALNDARNLLTPAGEFGLTYELLPGWAHAIANDLYFLLYRSPAAHNPGAGSTYWVTPPHGTPREIAHAHNTAAVKLVHAVHHGSIGHHTQNARAGRPLRALHASRARMPPPASPCSQAARWPKAGPAMPKSSWRKYPAFTRRPRS